MKIGLVAEAETCRSLGVLDAVVLPPPYSLRESRRRRFETATIERGQGVRLHGTDDRHQGQEKERSSCCLFLHNASAAVSREPDATDTGFMVVTGPGRGDETATPTAAFVSVIPGRGHT